MRFISLKLKKIDVLIIKATPAHKKDLKKRQKRSNTDLIMGASESAFVKNIKEFRLNGFNEIFTQRTSVLKGKTKIANPCATWTNNTNNDPWALATKQ